MTLCYAYMIFIWDIYTFVFKVGMCLSMYMILYFVCLLALCVLYSFSHFTFCCCYFLQKHIYRTTQHSVQLYLYMNEYMKKMSNKKLLWKKNFKLLSWTYIHKTWMIYKGRIWLRVFIELSVIIKVWLTILF